jgi:hypothetical protein
MNKKQAEAALDAAVKDGQMRRVGKDSFALTAKGKRRAEQIMRSRGVDPKAAKHLSLPAFWRALGFDQE